MSILAEILFAIFQYLPIWNKSDRANSSKFAAIALLTVVLVVIILIYKYNPASQHQINSVYSSSI